MCCRALLVKVMSMYMWPWRREKVPEISNPFALSASSHTWKEKCYIWCLIHMIHTEKWYIFLLNSKHSRLSNQCFVYKHRKLNRSLLVRNTRIKPKVNEEVFLWHFYLCLSTLTIHKLRYLRKVNYGKNLSVSQALQCSVHSLRLLIRHKEQKKKKCCFSVQYAYRESSENFTAANCWRRPLFSLLS